MVFIRFLIIEHLIDGCAFYAIFTLLQIAGNNMNVRLFP